MIIKEADRYRLVGRQTRPWLTERKTDNSMKTVHRKLKLDEQETCEAAVQKTKA